MSQATQHIAIDRRAVMLRAWEIFRERYKYPQMPFKSIGRKCFGWALHVAHHERRETLRLKAMGRERIEARMAEIREEKEMARYLPGHMSLSRRTAELDREYTALKAAA